MVGSAVLGAALGTGAALLIAMTIVVYRYYNYKRQDKEWNSIDRVPYQRVSKPIGTYPKTGEEGEKFAKMSGFSPVSCWLTHKTVERWTRAAKERALGSISRNGSTNSSMEDFNVSKEQLNIQPPHHHSMTAEIMKNPLEVCTAQTSNLQQQSKSYPCGTPLLCRTPSASSQSSLDSCTSKQGSHRGSSPQIRAFAPDGKQAHFHQEATHTSSYPLHRGSSRSPSPHRAASLDIRSSSPGCNHDLRTPSPSQSSLASLTGGSGSTCNSPVPASPRTANFSRCLSPLLIPASRGPTPDNGSTIVPPASPLGAIQPDLYVKKEGPLFIGESNKEGGSLGRLHFRLSYDFDRSDLVVHLIEAHDLAGSDRGGFNDPYVKILLMPEVDTRKRQTNIHRNDANPVFNEIFKFPISHEDLHLETLLLQVYDYDKFSRNDIIGEVNMSLRDFDYNQAELEVWGEIGKSKKPQEEMQEILVCLAYLPSAERLTLSLVKARNLFVLPDKETLDPFVKVYLTINGKRIKKKKTHCKKNTCNPTWNEAMLFNLNSPMLQNAEFEICVYDQGNDIMGSHPLLGTCTIGPKSNGSGKDHWNDMLQTPRKSVYLWHTLRNVSANGQNK